MNTPRERKASTIPNKTKIIAPIAKHHTEKTQIIMHAHCSAVQPSFGPLLPTLPPHPSTAVINPFCSSDADFSGFVAERKQQSKYRYPHRLDRIESLGSTNSSGMSSSRNVVQQQQRMMIMKKPKMRRSATKNAVAINMLMRAMPT